MKLQQIKEKKSKLIYLYPSDFERVGIGKGFCRSVNRVFRKK